MLVELLCVVVLNMGIPNAQLACDHMEDVVEAADINRIDPAILISLIHHESRWKATAVSPRGACGLTQVLPKYTRNPKLTCRQLKNPQTSIHAGAHALARWLEKTQYTQSRALCAYNAGYSCGKRYRKGHGGWRYSRKVRQLAKKIRQQLRAVETEYDDGC